MKLHLAIVPILAVLVAAYVLFPRATPRPAALPNGVGDPSTAPTSLTDGASQGEQRTGAPSSVGSDLVGPSPRASGAPKPSGGLDKGSYCSEPTCGYVEPSRKPSRIPQVDNGITGTASWYAYIPGGAAAGPRLRAFLGPHWRGAIVRVCAGSSCVVAQLSDWCGCNTGAEKLIDLDRQLFAALAPLSQGVVVVTVQVVGR